jgi:hypothetical protein
MFRWIAPALVIGLLAAAPVQAQPPAAQPAQQAEAKKSPFVFQSDGGVILHFIKPDKGADFEMLVAKLKEALAKSEKPEHKAQAGFMETLQAAEPVRPARSCASVFGRKDADCYIPLIINGVSAEGRALQQPRRQRQSSANKLTLTLLQDLAK